MYSILAVDDREIFLIELKRLKVWGDKSGFKIIDIALNGKEAIELLNKNSYDLILTDIRMPIVDGLQLLREVKNNKLCKCVVILSEYSEFNYARQGIILGAFDYLVKPATEVTMLELLKRTKIFLDKTYNKECDLANISIDADSEWIYPTSDERQIIKHLINKDNAATQLLQATIENLYSILSNNIIKADIIIKKMYHNIITAVYDEFNWLSNYININFFETMDYMHEENINAFMEFYCRKIAWLLEFLRKFHVEASDELIGGICKYILNNPDCNLRLKFISEKFYVNNTYLSNTFANKIGIGFNEYITMIKMARAQYLLVNTKLKTYEICYKMGYHDINYFSRLFKKYYGKSPSEYRNVEVGNYQI